jgi:hypothetical protein
MILHGGIGDGIWVLKKAINFGKPLYVTISSENRHRPRRSAALYEHVPQVFGWDYSDKSFAEGGQDWTQSANDPACAMDVTWREFNAPVGKPFRIECNRWLESGRRLDDWLPDLQTTHNFQFAAPGPANLTFRKPCVVFHIAGWPDLHDGQWTALIDLFRGTAHAYIVGGSYDRRPRQIYTMVAGRGGVTLMEDVAWEDLVGVLSACDYCFGHASGFTAIADVMRVPGVVINPRSVPRLNGTWNSPDSPDQVHVNTPEEFSSAVYQAFKKMSGTERATWPPTGIRGARLTSAGDRLGAIRSAAQAARPKQAAVYANEGHHSGIGAAILDGAFSVGAVVSSIHMIGCAQDAVDAVNREAARSTRKPIVTTGTGAWPAGRGNETFDLIVVITTGPPAFAAQCVRDAWRSVSPTGTLLFSGTYAASAAEALGAGLTVKPQTVVNADGWWFIHRRS